LVEHQLPKLRVAGSSPVSRSEDSDPDGPAALRRVAGPFSRPASSTRATEPLVRRARSSDVNRSRDTRVLVALLTFSAAVSGCGDSTGPEGGGGAVSLVDVTPFSAVLGAAGESIRFSASPRGADGSPVSGAGVSWASSDPTVAVVSPDGTATAVGPGSATITATAGGVKGIATVAVAPDTVAPTITSVTIDKTRVDILNKPGLVTMWADLADDRSGVAQVIANFESPSGATITAIVVLDRLEGTPAAGRYQGFLEVPANSAVGTWTLSTVRAQDAAGNVALWQKADLDGLGLAVSFIAVWGGGG
jgi:Bacterial Ig-like domain (group 2)